MERVFRRAHLRGSQDRVCRFALDFGSGPVAIWTAADNADFASNRAMNGEAERQIRIVFDTDGQTLGVSVQYEAMIDAPSWQLLWRRRDALIKPLTDATLSARTVQVLESIPDQCATPAP